MSQKTVTIETQTTAVVEVDVKILAEIFCGMDDETQAQFFIEVSRIAENWPGPGYQGMQWFNVGAHLRNCECSDDLAREVIEELHNGLTNGAHRS